MIEAFGLFNYTEGFHEDDRGVVILFDTPEAASAYRRVNRVDAEVVPVTVYERMQ